MIKSFIWVDFKCRKKWGNRQRETRWCDGSRWLLAGRSRGKGHLPLWPERLRYQTFRTTAVVAASVNSHPVAAATRVARTGSKGRKSGIAGAR
ncbi:hypothetical protein [Paenibacillus sp. VTT E-133291]|uniref:hypothetical protein n=1 Tax=Paenibacillus sp. VTT E-133291 TaxID=1986223 RepID=UPI00117CFD7D|nr:hypothetical protein [Paenibacillus sp. VTT E-133291]